MEKNKESNQLVVKPIRTGEKLTKVLPENKESHESKISLI